MWIKKIGFLAGVILPLWNIPLIWRIIQRKSSADISLYWVFGVWVCIVLMFPATLLSQDMGFKYFGIVNTIFFSGVVATVMVYRKKN